MTIWIENPFAGFEVGWTWAQHVAQGYQGGTDYIFYPGDGDIAAAADGRITLQPGTNGFTPGTAIILTLADGRSINYREVATPLVKTGQTVTRGQAIGVPNAHSRWPHIDATVGGVRVHFEPLVNIGTDPSGEGTPVPIMEVRDMQAIRSAAGAIALVGELTVSLETAAGWVGDQLVWGNPIQLTDQQYADQIAAVAARRAQLGITAGAGGGVTESQVIEAVKTALTGAKFTTSATGVITA